MARRRRVVIYRRISRTTAESVSLARQEKELRKVCDLEAWDVVEVITDDGKTGTKERAEAVRALDMLRSDRADTLLVWEFSRWSRQGLPAVSELLETLKDRKDLLFFAWKDGLRSDRAAWRLVAAVLAEVAAMEAESTRDRIRAARAFHLAQTDPDEQRYLGSSVPFGYIAAPRPEGKPGKMLIPDPSEVPIIQEVAEMLVSGATLGAATLWLDAQEVPTPQSAARKDRQQGRQPPAELPAGYRGAWRASTVRNLWRADALMGRTRHSVPVVDEHGEPVRLPNGRAKMREGLVTDEKGLPITRWEPIISQDTFAQLQERFKAPGRTQPRRMASWLTGVLYCMACGRRLYVHRRARNDKAEHFFRCAGVTDVLNPCKAPARVYFAGIEGYVERRFLEVARQFPEYETRQYLDTPDVTNRLTVIAHAIQETLTAMATDDGDGPALLAIVEDLKEERRALQAQPSTVRIEKTPTGRTLGDIWDTTADDLRERRDVLLDIIGRVYVAAPDVKGHPTPLDPAHVRIVWDSDVLPDTELEDGLPVADATNRPLISRADDGKLTFSTKAAWIIDRAEEALALESADSTDADVLALRAALAAFRGGNASAARQLADILRLDVVLPKFTEETAS